MTVAGNGTAGNSGDGGAATSAQLKLPVEVVVDSSNDVYIADASSYCVRKLDNVSGIITTYAGTCGSSGFSGDGGLATSAKLKTAVSVAVDNSGNLYIADYNDQRVRKVNSSGIITTLAGIGSAGTSGDGGSASAAQLYNPRGVAVDSVGNVYITDNGSHRVRKVDTSGIITTVAGTGTGGYSGDGGPATSAKLNGPFRIAVDSADNFYITDNGNHCVRKVDKTTGIITTIAGTGTAGFSGDAGAATSAKLNSPTGVNIDRVGNIYIADMNNHRIRQINTSGIITTVTGTGSAGFSGDGGPAASAQLNSPRGMAVDSAGNIYIADTNNYRIRSIANQMITFNPPASVTMGDAPITLSATGGASGNAVTFDSTTPTICTVSGTTLTIVAVGTCTVTADQAGTATYGAAPQVSKDITVNKLAQTITGFSPASSATYGDAPISLSATGGASGNAVTFDSTTTSVCTVSGTTLTVVGVGTCTVTADQAGNASYSTASQVSKNITVNQVTQTITGFSPSTSVTYGDAAITLSASASSGLTVAFASTTASVCTVSGTTLTILDVGTCTVTADQAGNATYSAASQVSKNITVDKKTITAQADNKSRAIGIANPTFTISYTGLVGSDTISTPPSATTTATISSPVGTYPITCTGGSDSKYTIGSCADGSLNVTLTPPSITVTSAAASVALGTAVTANFAVSGSPTPTGTVTVTDGVVSCNATVAAGTCNLTPTTAGVKTLTATYSGDSNYGTGTATAPVGIAGVISSVPSLSLAEGATGNYTLKLATAPNSDVVITLTPNAQVTVIPTTLTFTTANWNTPQTVTVTVVDDTVYQGNRTVSITQAITTADTTLYLTTFNIPAMSVAITDNESPPPPPYVPPSYNLTLKTTGTGKGTISGTTAGLYTVGTNVSLTATADSGSEFKGWTSTSCGSAFNLSADTTCTAQFDLKPVVVSPPVVTPPPVITYQLSVSSSGTGTGIVGGTVAGIYAAGTNVTLTATADSASTFVSWTPASCGSTFNLSADITCTAQFDLKPVPPVITPPVVTPVTTYKLTVNTTGIGQGIVGGTPTGTYPTGTSVVLTATADANSIFTGWTPENCASFNLNGDNTCIAEFSLRPSTAVGGISTPPCVYNKTLAAATICGGAGQKTTITRIGSTGQLSSAIVDALLINEGWLSSSTITVKGQVKGGTLTGQIENHGIISDFDFKGGSLIGGILSGNITNSSTVGGYFQNVTFTANASLNGGILQGTIRGNPNAPVVLKNVRVKAGTILSGIVLGTGVSLEQGVTIIPNVTLPLLDKPTVVDTKGNSSKTSSAFYGGISVSGRPYTQQSQQLLAEPVVVRGRIIAAPEHIGQKVDLFVYSPYFIGTHLYGYYMADESSNILLWNQKVPELVAFKKGVVLESVHDIDMFVGHFIATGGLNIVFGYRLSDGTVVMNNVPSTIDVTVQ